MGSFIPVLNFKTGISAIIMFNCIQHLNLILCLIATQGNT